MKKIVKRSYISPKSEVSRLQEGKKPTLFMFLKEVRVSECQTANNTNQEKLMKLVRKWLQAGVMEGTIRRSDLGTPQGGVISPLLANIYLNYFDILWERHGNARDG